MPRLTSLTSQSLSNIGVSTGGEFAWSTLFSAEGNNTNFETLAYNGAGGIVAVTQSKVWTSTDSGVTWQETTPPANLFQNAENFSDTYWTVWQNAISVTANDTTAPNGTLTADRITANGTNTAHYVSRQVAGAIPTEVGQPYTISVYAKAGTESTLIISTNWIGGRIFNLSNGTSSSTGVLSPHPDAYYMTDVGDGWYRCSIVTNSAPAASIEVFFQTETENAYYWLWGAQFERGTSPSTYPALGANNRSFGFVEYGSGRFVLAGVGAGSNTIWTSPDQGMTWTNEGSNQLNGVNQPLLDLQRLGFEFIALGQYGELFTSPSGLSGSWTQRLNLGINKYFSQIVMPSLANYVAYNLNRPYSSNDGGVTWTAGSTTTGVSTVVGLAWDGTQIIGAGYNYTTTYEPVIVRSLDNGVTWATESTNLKLPFARLFYYNGRFLAHDRGQIQSSLDGMYWSPVVRLPGTRQSYSNGRWSPKVMEGRYLVPGAVTTPAGTTPTIWISGSPSSKASFNSTSHFPQWVSGGGNSQASGGQNYLRFQGAFNAGIGQNGPIDSTLYATLGSLYPGKTIKITINSSQKWVATVTFTNNAVYQTNQVDMYFTVIGGDLPFEYSYQNNGVCTIEL